MKQKFIYVFSDEARDALLMRDFQMLSGDEKRHIYVFLNDGNMSFSYEQIPYTLSNTLTF